MHRIKHYFHPNLVSVVAYCLMPNHYHLLVFLKTNKFGLEVMQPFTVSYTKAINKQQDPVGPLFQGPYKAKQLENNSYLLHLSRYIHLNPVTAGLVTVPEAWEYSSYGEFIAMRSSTFIKSEVLIDQFPNRDAYAAFVYNQRGPGDGLPMDLLFD